MHNSVNGGEPLLVHLTLTLPTSALQVGVLTRSILDDGRGLARSKVFKHGHEEDTGEGAGWREGCGGVADRP